MNFSKIVGAIPCGRPPLENRQLKRARTSHRPYFWKFHFSKEFIKAKCQQKLM